MSYNMRMLHILATSPYWQGYTLSIFLHFVYFRLFEAIQLQFLGSSKKMASN